MIKGLFNSGSMPVLERMIQFTAARHDVLAHNIANLDTPNYRPTDMPVASFQQALGEAIERRHKLTGGSNAPLELRDTQDLRFTCDTVEARTPFRDQNILFHDRNNRSLEDHMKDLAENTLAHNTAVDLLRQELEILDIAIRERI